MACLIHSSMPARGPGEAPSLLPVYGIEPGTLGLAFELVTAAPSVRVPRVAVDKTFIHRATFLEVVRARQNMPGSRPLGTRRALQVQTVGRANY
jgi:hypothetical protein